MDVIISLYIRDGILQPETAEILFGISPGGEAEIKETKKKYAKSALSPEISENCYNRLIKLMEEKKPYLQNNLTLQSLAQLLSVSNHHLSQVINEKTSQNFFEFINRYRVEEAKKLLADRRNDHLSIAAISFDAGFNSLSSFNNIFKKVVKITPSGFRNSQN